MKNPYTELFRAPGSKGFAFAGLLARMPLSMSGIGIITMLSLTKGSYGLAGAVAATYTFASAIIAPQISHAVDRHGQGKILPLAVSISGLGMALMLACSWLNAPLWTLFVFAVLAGFMPSMPAMIRARWTEIYRGTPQVNTAYALETVLDEVSFIIGPPLSVGLCVALFPEAGPLTALVLLIAGVTAFVLQRSTEPPVHPVSKADEGSALRLPAVRIITVMLAAMGVIVGTVDVASVAFAQSQKTPVAAGIVLSAYALGSCAAGLLFGAIRLNTPLHRLFLYGGIGTALATTPMFFAWNIMTLSLAVLIAGLFFGPTMIVSMGLIELSVAETKLTEGLTWLITGLSIGIACGAALSGRLIDAFGVYAGFMVALGAGVCVFGVAIYGYCHFNKMCAC